MDIAFAKVNFRVRDLDAAVAYATDVLGATIIHTRHPISFGEMAMVQLGGLVMEIIAPSSPDSPIARLIETRGEGVFLQFKESAIQAWLSRPAVKAQAEVYAESYAANLAARKLDPERQPTLGMRYLLLHSFSHALMRQVTLECGYTAASLSERIYAVDEGDEGEPQAGLLIYTAAPDSEGTLGGLVSLGEAKMLEPLVAQALESMRLCASDPLCAEHEPGGDSAQLHGAACHACLLAPETSCERGNRFLDRAVLVETISQDRLGFFG